MTPPILNRIEQHRQSTAVVSNAESKSCDELLIVSRRLASRLLADKDDLSEARIAFLIPPGFEYVAALLGIWQAGGIAVPLGLTHPPPEWEYVLDDTEASAVVVHGDFKNAIAPLAEQRSIPLHSLDENGPAIAGPVGQTGPALSRRAMILYTSGTTSKPKGVVTTHANIQAQIEALVGAWEWTAQDRILHALPLHHVHGIVNALLCALWAGAACEFIPFEARRVWERIGKGGLTLIMAVPTMYAKLIAAWENAKGDEQRIWSNAANKMRLMVSGSAALPVSVLEKWRSITGHTLLERYGMTEIGMALSNPLHGERTPGHVGLPLPGVEVRITDAEQKANPHKCAPFFPVGDIEVRGPQVFKEYWRRPDATAAAFRDGWFQTGDVAVIEDGSFRILGRSNVDIIKTGGYKVSALEIESALLEHSHIQECAIVGVPDPEWGERICACVVLADNQSLTLDELRAWAKERLAVYKIPKSLLAVPELPRNAMGKVQKQKVAVLFRKPE